MRNKGRRAVNLEGKSMNSMKIKKEEYFENYLNTMRGVLEEKNKRGI